MPSLVLDQWIELGMKPCAAITPTAYRNEPEDMPLNNASYDAARDKIYAVGYGRLFRFNGSGVREAVFRYNSVQIGDDSYCAYDLTTDSIWVTRWMSTATNLESVAAQRNDHLLQINPTTFAIVNDYDIGTDLGVSQNQAWGGPRKILTNAGIGFITRLRPETPTLTTYRYDLSNVPASWTHNQNQGGSSKWENLDIANGVLFYCNNEQNTVKASNLSDLNDTGNNSATHVTRRFFGSCWSTVNSRVYACCGSQFVRKLEIGGAQATTEIDLNRPSANPHNIRFNANNNRVYVPLYADNTVAVINPADDTFEIKTGFDSPFDCVFSATKAFALQHSSVGLKEIV